MATEEFVTYWVAVERGDGAEWEQFDSYPMLYPPGHANALAASACDMRHAGVESRVPVRVRVWEATAVVPDAHNILVGEPTAVWVRGPLLTADDARRILAGVHTPESADDAAWRNLATSEHDAVVRDVLDAEAKANRIAAEREAYTDAVEAVRDLAFNDERYNRPESDDHERCLVPILVKGFPRECGERLPCLRHPKRDQD